MTLRVLLPLINVEYYQNGFLEGFEWEMAHHVTQHNDTLLRFMCSDH